MPTLPTRFLALTIALFMVSAATPAAAKRGKLWHRPAVAARHARPVAPPCRGGNLFPCGPVYSNRQYLGDDPDPFIRLQLLRMYGHTASLSY
jgi:hypothetical protein